MRKEADTYDPEQYEKLTEAFQIMNNFLEGQDYVTGDNLTIADLALVASVTTAEVISMILRNISNYFLSKIKQ